MSQQTEHDLGHARTQCQQCAREYARAHAIGPWPTEEASAAALDDILGQDGLWTIHREVKGTLSQPRPTQPDKGLRIDRVLVPTQKLISEGWTHGIIGIEVKASGVKIGTHIAQAMDYSRAVWTLPNNFKVWLDWVFLWPVGRQTGTVESILTQNRIGCAHASDWVKLILQNGGEHLLNIGLDGKIRIGAGRNGQKAGSR